DRVSLPVNTSLNCTMPELVKSSVGSLPGTSDAEGTMVCPFDWKNCRNFWRISEDFMLDEPGFRRIFDYRGSAVRRYSRRLPARPGGYPAPTHTYALVRAPSVPHTSDETRTGVYPLGQEHLPVMGLMLEEAPQPSVPVTA